MAHHKHHLQGKKIDPPTIDAETSLIDLIDLFDLIDHTFNAYNAGRFCEARHLGVCAVDREGLGFIEIR
jgi:hypothetical protein